MREPSCTDCGPGVAHSPRWGRGALLGSPPSLQVHGSQAQGCASRLAVPSCRPCRGPVQGHLGSQWGVRCVWKAPPKPQLYLQDLSPPKQRGGGIAVCAAAPLVTHCLWVPSCARM